MQKFLWAVPRKYRQMAMAIESLIDLKTMTIEELTGRLSACEDHYDLDDTTQSGARLMYTSAEWDARERQLRSGGLSSGGNNKGKSPGKNKSQGGGKATPPSADASGSGGSGGKKKGKCHYCNKPGHWKKECHTRINDEDEKGKQGQAHLVRERGEHHEGASIACSVHLMNQCKALS